MKHLKCINPTKLLNKGQVYLCKLVWVCDTVGFKNQELETNRLEKADYVYVQTVFGAHGGNLRVKADRFKEIDQVIYYTPMKKQIEPVYNIVNAIYPDETQIGISKDELLKYLNGNNTMYADTIEFVDMLRDEELIISKTSIKNGRHVTEEINDKIKLTFTL